MVTVAYMNEWLSKHRTHRIRFYRRRIADLWMDPHGHPLPEAAGIPHHVTLSLTCDDCNTGFLAGIEKDEGQDVDV
jgi:hypothetical protein